MIFSSYYFQKKCIASSFLNCVYWIDYKVVFKDRICFLLLYMVAIGNSVKLLSFFLFLFLFFVKAVFFSSCCSDFLLVFGFLWLTLALIQTQYGGDLLWNFPPWAGVLTFISRPHKAAEPKLTWSIWVNAIGNFGMLASLFCLILWIQDFPKILV